MKLILIAGIVMCIACLTVIVMARKIQNRKEKMYSLMELPYAFNALEPYMDARTVEIHYTKHHQAYVNKLNEALAKAPAEIRDMPLAELLVSLDRVPEDIRTAVRNNGGGVFAHDMFWLIMSPHAGGNATGELLDIIDRDFGSFDAFKDKFNTAAKNFFGSGWVWLVVNKDGKLSIVTTPGHDVPMQQGYQPLMVLDVWEHAYYLKYQNRRPEYIDNWWNLVNWDQVQINYEEALQAIGR